MNIGKKGLALIKEFDDLVTKYKGELIKKYQRESK